MRLNDASMAIRPRTAWEALDLGILLARRHAVLLMSSWALVTLPIFALFSLLFWQHPTLSLLLFWWFKPLYERLPLFILSRALFGDTPSLRQSISALPSLLRSQWFASVTWRRFSVTRSFDLPVLQLEQLAGSARQQRLAVLGQRDRRAASWLTLVGMHLEMGLWFGALALIYMLIPQQMLADWDWQDLFSMNGDWLWFEHLSNLLYALVLVVWEPIYAASGFSLYLNRRTTLEAWDIELTFRRLQARMKSLLPVLLVGLGLWLVSPPEVTFAATGAEETTQTIEPSGPDSDRLLKQPLTSKAASQRIGELLDQPPFRNRETVTRWRFTEAADEEPGWLAHLLERLLRSDLLTQHTGTLASVIEVLLWAALFGLTGLLLWRYRDWLKLYATPGQMRIRQRQTTPAMLFGLDLQPESIPADVVAEVQRLWHAHPREALGLLYRAFLSRLLHERQVPLKNSHTEGEILELLRQQAQPQLLEYAEALTRHWLRLAYGHQLPPERARDELCERWRVLFGSERLA
ncbi:DUF4129 domain-containing protein [Stutzerimonas xanthomarina]|uniref:DUF4129 domain-containing protein n=1 Tax=Stutzerimonas xanthomarina TaxID=271420 RepID=UPI003AA85EA9